MWLVGVGGAHARGGPVGAGYRGGHGQSMEASLAAEVIGCGQHRPLPLRLASATAAGSSESGGTVNGELAKDTQSLTSARNRCVTRGRADSHHDIRPDRRLSLPSGSVPDGLKPEHCGGWSRGTSLTYEEKRPGGMFNIALSLKNCEPFAAAGEIGPTNKYLWAAYIVAKPNFHAVGRASRDQLHTNAA